MSLRDMFKKDKGPSEAEIAAAERELRLRDKLTKQLQQDPRFRVFSIDGLSWVDPFTGHMIETPFDQLNVSLSYLLEKRPWKGGVKPKAVRESLAIRWVAYLKEVMPEDRRFRFFDRRGAWLDPYLGVWVPAVRFGDKVDIKSLYVIAEYFAAQDQDALQEPQSESALEELAQIRQRASSSALPVQRQEDKQTVVKAEQETKHASDTSRSAKSGSGETEYLAAGHILGGFRVEDLLGVGGMGQVYRAVQVSLERTVALKVLPTSASDDDDFRQRFIREARCAAAINHPHVVACYDVGYENGYLFMAQELVQGGDAADLAYDQPEGRLDEKTTLQIVRDCALGLTAIDEASLVHRDIKPANIFINKRGRAKIGDLGLTRTQNNSITIAGKIIGTPAFMSPEQITDGEHLDVRSDIYALGASAYALLTNAAPFEHSSVYTVINMVVNKDPKPLSELRSDLQPATVALIERMMAKDRDVRFAHAEALIPAVEDILSQLVD